MQNEMGSLPKDGQDNGGNKTLKTVLIIIVLIIAVGLVVWVISNKTDDKNESQQKESAPANQTQISKTETTPSSYQIKNVPYCSEQGGFCFGESMKMILEYLGFSKDQTDEYEEYVKLKGKGGPPDMFLKLDKFDVATDIHIAYSKNYDNKMAEFYYQVIDNLKERTTLFTDQNDALAKLKQLVSSNIPVIAIIENGIHYAVVTGYDQNNIYVNNPDPRDGENQIIQVEEFLNQWNVSKQEELTSGNIGYPGDYGMIWIEKDGEDDSGENDNDDIDDDMEDGEMDDDGNDDMGN